MKPKPCKDCGSLWHSAWYHKPRKAMTSTRRMRPESKKHKDNRLETTAEWFALNGNGPWACYLQIAPDCERIVTKETVNIEHPLSKVRHPGLRWDAKRLKPACGPCNELKGSKDYIDGKLV